MSVTILARDGQRDVRRPSAGGPPGEPTGPESAPLSTLITTDVLCVKPEVRLEDAVALLLGHAIGGLPVVDASAKPIGMLTRSDALRAYVEPREVPTPVTVRGTMSPSPRTLPANASVWEAAAVLSMERFHHLIVVGDDGEVVGMLSALDLVSWMSRHHGWPGIA